MAKYLVEASYSAEGLKGLIKETGKGREAAIGKWIAASGGKLDSLHWSLGGSDVYLICDLPDNVTAASLSLQASSSGAIRTKTTPLFTAAEVDQAIAKGVAYRAPGAKGKK